MGQKRRLFGMSDRVVVFEPEDLDNLLKTFELTATEMANYCGIKPGTFRKWVTRESKNLPLAELDTITQKFLELYRNRDKKHNYELPKRIALINPYFLKKEMDKRCVSLDTIMKKVGKGTMSKEYVTQLIKNKYHKSGPLYKKYRLVSEAVMSEKVKSEQEQLNFWRNSKEYDINKDTEYIDDSGNPKLSDGKLWDFHEAQREWIERDSEKLKNLPRVGQLTNYSKVTKKS